MLRLGGNAVDAAVAAAFASFIAEAGVVHLGGRGIAQVYDARTGLTRIYDFFSVVPPNPDLDVDFNLSITCADSQMSFAVQNASVNVDTIPRIDLPDIPFPGLSNVDDFVESQLNSLMDEAEAVLEAALSIDDMESAFADSLSQLDFSAQTPICPQINVQTNGDIAFSL